MAALPACPKCGRSREVMASGDRLYYCHRCKMQFDDDPDEGGDWSDRRPEARLEREERRGTLHKR